MNKLRICICSFILALSSISCDIDTNEEEDMTSCPFDNGMHEATVDYYNPDTDFSNTYTLDVEVDNCQVVKIEFPKGGWLDEDHIGPTDIDDDGTCTIEDDQGRTYTIQIEN